MGLTATLTALVLAAAQAAPLDVYVWNDIPSDVVVSIPGGAPVNIPHNKERDFTAPRGGRLMTVSYRGCDYPFTLPDVLDAYQNEGEGGPVRFYLWDGPVLYVVPTDLEMQSPINYLEPKQPIQFPLYPGNPVCKAGPG
jgi:hypothetical protein